mgnify:CR=1 FL=1
MKKSLLITSFLILIPFISVHSQETDSLSSHSDFNTFFDARIGLAFQGSLNLETHVFKGRNSAFLLNTGISYMWSYIEWALFYQDSYSYFGFPTTATVLLGSLPYDQRSKHLDINVGLINYVDTNQIIPIPRATIGYRYQNPQTGKIFRIYGGFLSIGMSFNL